MRTATPAQAELIRKMMQSHVITPEERAGLERRLERGFDRNPAEAIDWLQSEIKTRKAAEKAEAEAAQGELAPQSAPERWLAKAPPTDRPALNRLFGAEADGSRWLVATNGHLAIGERSERVADPFDSDAGQRTLVGTMIPTGVLVGELTREALFEFAGEPEYRGPMQCSDCEGSGVHECDCDYCDHAGCFHCKGSGTTEEAPAERPGWIGPHVFNLVYVAQVLAEVPDGMIRLTVGPWMEGQTDGGRLYLEGGEWRACIFGMRHRSGGGEFRDYSAAPRLVVGGSA